MKKLLMVLAAIVMAGTFAANAGAWEVNLSDAYDVGGYWAYDITFDGDGSENLNTINLSLGYDTDDVTFVDNGVIFVNYDDGALPFPNPFWEGGGFPAVNDTSLGLLYNIMGEEPLGESGLFYPGADTLLFTVYFQEVNGGNFNDTSVYFTYGSDLTGLVAEAVNVNGEILNNHDLLITANSITAPVPVPGAVWLMGSGLLGLVGLRRRNH